MSVDSRHFVAICRDIISIVALQSNGDFDDLELLAPIRELAKQAKALGLRWKPLAISRKHDYCEIDILWPHGVGTSELAWRIKTPELKLGVKYAGMPFKVCEKPEDLKRRIVTVLESWIRHAEASSWDGTVKNLPGAAFGYVIDEIMLGPAPAWGNRFQVSNFDCVIVPGDTPSICRNADRKPLAKWLPDIESMFLRLDLVPAGCTIHWTGAQAKVENVCQCDRDRVGWAGALGDEEPTNQSRQAKAKRGRPQKADYETQQREAKLAADWERAREAGEYKPDFAKRKGFKIVGDFDQLLDRVYQRRRSKLSSE